MKTAGEFAEEAWCAHLSDTIKRVTDNFTTRSAVPTLLTGYPINLTGHRMWCLLNGKLRHKIMWPTLRQIS